MNPALAATSDEMMRPPHPRTNLRLYRLGLAGLIAAMVVATHRSELQDILLLILGNAVMILGAFPALRWARTGALHFPTFEIFSLTAIPFYALPLLAGHPSVLEFSDETTLQAALAVVLFQVTAVSTFLRTAGKSARSVNLTATLLPRVAIQYAQAGLWLYSIYLYINGFTDWIPAELRTPFRAMFSGLGIVSLFIEMRRWGMHTLQSGQKMVIVFNLFIQIVFLFRDLYLITGISLLLLALIGYVSTSRKIPLVVIGCLLPALGVLHNGKSGMRKEYWENQTPKPDLVGLPAYFQQWIEFGFQSPSDEDEGSAATLTGRLFERASLFQMLCLVVERTPDIDPYLGGESYKQIPIQLIPSFLWPGKPSSLLSNILLAIHYGLVPEDNPASVSIAFGMIAEAYANFGLIGCIVLGLVLGFGYKRISIAAIGCPQFSALGLLSILLAAWSFQVEQIFATWLVSLLQATLVVVGVPVVFRILFHQE